MGAGPNLDKLKPLQDQKPQDTAGQQRGDPNPAQATVTPSEVPSAPVAAQRVLDRKAVTNGAAQAGGVNDFQHLPQWHMEARGWSETVDAVQGAGELVLDLAFANVFYVDMTGDATIVLSGFPSLPYGQPDRPRGAAVSLTVRRNGHALQFGGGILWPEGGQVDLDFDDDPNTWDDFAFKGIGGGQLAALPYWPGPGGLWLGYVTGLNRKAG